MTARFWLRRRSSVVRSNVRSLEMAQNRSSLPVLVRFWQQPISMISMGDATERVRQAARRIFKAVDGYGLSRVDFFVTKDGEVIFNEINTMPGFTAISMYPMLFEAAGIPKPEMVTKLIEHGLKRYEA